MSHQPISLLGYALLGLLQQQARSGYDLRRLFAQTPLMTFSDSPGAIYPALRRLEEGNYIQGRVERAAGLRLRKIFRTKPRGTSALKKWITSPVMLDDVLKRGDELMLRFAFMSRLANSAQTLEFLSSLEVCLVTHIDNLKEFRREHAHEMELSEQLALEGGIAGHEAHAEWVRHARRAFGGDKRRRTPAKRGRK